MSERHACRQGGPVFAITECISLTRERTFFSASWSNRIIALRQRLSGFARLIFTKTTSCVRRVIQFVLRELEVPMGSNDKKALWPSAEQVKNAHEDLRNKLMHEELECALQFRAVNRLMNDLRVDRESFRKLWVQPLLTAGATLEVALVCIAQSHFQPN